MKLRLMNLVSARRWVSTTLTLLFALLLAACGSGGMGGGAGCAPADLVEPDNSAPAPGEIVLDMNPLFVWGYTSCEPDNYQLQVTTYGGYEYGTTYTELTPLGGGLILNEVLDTALQPASQYEWRVAAIHSGVMGPYSYSTSFWTGPICATALLNAPQQETPENYAVVTNEFPPMGWNYPDGCIPEGTLLELDTDPNFPGPNLAHGFGGPRIGQIPLDALDDCTTYYWHVRSENPDGTGPFSPVRSFRTDFTGSCTPPPTCDTSALIAPFPGQPVSGEIVDDLMPSFNWFYPDDCDPQGYRIDVTTYGGYEFGTTFSGGTGNPSLVWALADALQPATQYEWRVAGINDTTLGPYSPSTAFWTGPLCTSATLLAPVQETPADGAVVDNEFPPLGWSYSGGCLPPITLLELDTDSSFPGPNLVAGFGGPRIGQIPLDALDDCTTYYWRVRGETATTPGVYSPTWSFTTNFSGGCAGGALGGASPTGLALRNLNCRAGDSQVFLETGFFGQDDVSPILGRNATGTWFLIPRGLGNTNCWVSAIYVELQGNASLDALPVLSSPPTPMPSPTAVPPVAATATSQPQGGSFNVTDILTHVDKTHVTAGACPERFTFTARITVDGPGTVQYRWLRSDQVAGPVETLSFNQAGTQSVFTTWDLGQKGQTYTDFWQRVEILAPNSLLSSRAIFSLTCQ